MNLTIRNVRSTDAEAILRIYAPYVLESSVSFELELPSIEAMQQRIHDYTQKFPWFVACDGDKIIGYAYASTYRERAAYRFNVETSVYIDTNYQKAGIATQLYEILFDELKKLNLHQAFAVITMPNEKSEQFHRKFGFESFAIFKEVGFKFNQWHDVLWMKKSI